MHYKGGKVNEKKHQLILYTPRCTDTAEASLSVQRLKNWPTFSRGAGIDLKMNGHYSLENGG